MIEQARSTCNTYVLVTLKPTERFEDSDWHWDHHRPQTSVDPCTLPCTTPLLFALAAVLVTSTAKALYVSFLFSRSGLTIRQLFLLGISSLFSFYASVQLTHLSFLDAAPLSGPVTNL